MFKQAFLEVNLLGTYMEFIMFYVFRRNGNMIPVEWKRRRGADLVTTRRGDTPLRALFNYFDHFLIGEGLAICATSSPGRRYRDVFNLNKNESSRHVSGGGDDVPSCRRTAEADRGGRASAASLARWRAVGEACGTG